jgi:hypothetical protein
MRQNQDRRDSGKRLAYFTTDHELSSRVRAVSGLGFQIFGFGFQVSVKSKFQNGLVPFTRIAQAVCHRSPMIERSRNT